MPSNQKILQKKKLHSIYILIKYSYFRIVYGKPTLITTHLCQLIIYHTRKRAWKKRYKTKKNYLPRSFLFHHFVVQLSYYYYPCFVSVVVKTAVVFEITLIIMVADVAVAELKKMMKLMLHYYYYLYYFLQHFNYYYFPFYYIIFFIHN